MTEMSVASMRERIEELEETVLQLRETLRPKLMFVPEWRLSRQQSLFLALLYSRAGVSYDQIAVAFGLDPPENTADGYDCQNHAKVVAFNVRKKLAPFNIEFHTVHGTGYAMDSENKARVRAGIIAPEL